MGKSKSRRTIVLLYFPIAFLSTFIILLSIVSLNKIYKESDFVIIKILPSKIISTGILTSIVIQEASIRAYTLTNDKTLLEPYYLQYNQIQGYYSFLSDFDNIILGVKASNELNDQMKLIQTFFKQQIVLIDTGKSYEARSNINKGRVLVDKFRLSDTMLINKIDLQLSNSRIKASNTKMIIHILIYLEIILILILLIIIRYVYTYLYGEIEKKNEIIEKLQNSLISQEEFIANVSHELKTPLNVISSAVQLFQMYCYNGSLDERRENIIKYIDSIKLNSYRLSKLINNIVDSSKIKAGFFEINLSNNNIVEAVEEIVMSVTSFTECKGLNIIFDTDIEEKYIAFDPEKIERIVLNLLSNAIKFSDKGDEIIVHLKDKKEFVEISVKDNGIGIEEDHLNMIFDRFKQVNESLSRNVQGTGIGLSLVKSIVELHGGSISVESEVGKGSKFIVMIPSRKVFKDNLLYRSKVRCKDETILVELSDVGGVEILKGIEDNNEVSINKMIEHVLVTGYKKYRSLGAENIKNYANEINFQFKADCETTEEDINDLVINYIADKCGM